MSYVSNYIIEFGYGGWRKGPSDMDVIFAVSKSLENSDAANLGEKYIDLHRKHDSYYSSGKVLETDTHIYALNFVAKEQFLKAVNEALNKTNWDGGIQVLYKGQEDEFWTEIFKRESRDV